MSCKMVASCLTLAAEATFCCSITDNSSRISSSTCAATKLPVNTPKVNSNQALLPDPTVCIPECFVHNTLTGRGSRTKRFAQDSKLSLAPWDCPVLI